MIERRQAKQSVRAANTWNCRGKNRSWNFYFYEGECGHNRLPTTYRPTRDSRFKDLSFFLSLSSSRRHCSRKRGSDLCALVKNKFTAYGWLRSPTSEILFSTLNRIMRGEKEEELSKYVNPSPSISKEYFSLWRIINLYKLQIMKFPIV